MKRRSAFFVLLLCLYAEAQVPKYVSASSLLGWWKFDNNAQNSVIQGPNGITHGVAPAADRYGNSNQAYYFNGINNWIEFGNIIDVSKQSAMTISAWFKPAEMNGSQNSFTGIDIGKKTSGNVTLRVRGEWDYRFQSLYTEASPPGFQREYTVSNSAYIPNNWYHLVGIYKNGKCDLYVNGVKQSNTISSGGLLSNIPANASLYIGKSFNDYDVENFFIGSIDDVGIWNRELSVAEIDKLYKSCSLIAAEPISKSAVKNSSISFTVTSSDPSATFTWQTNPSDNGWQDVATNSRYAGSKTNTLTVQNISLSNHLQPFRVVLNSGTCSDTSGVVTFSVKDTCLMSVTDTLIINTLATHYQQPNKDVQVKIYPNPARNYVFVGFDNYLKMSGYSLRITSGIGSVVFAQPINKQQIEIKTSDLGSDGLYIIQIISPDNEVTESRKLLIH